MTNRQFLTLEEWVTAGFSEVVEGLPGYLWQTFDHRYSIVLLDPMEDEAGVIHTTVGTGVLRRKGTNFRAVLSRLSVMNVYADFTTIEECQSWLAKRVANQLLVSVYTSLAGNGTVGF